MYFFLTSPCSYSLMKALHVVFTLLWTCLCNVSWNLLALPISSLFFGYGRFFQICKAPITLPNWVFISFWKKLFWTVKIFQFFLKSAMHYLIALCLELFMRSWSILVSSAFFWTLNLWFIVKSRAWILHRLNASDFHRWIPCLNFKNAFYLMIHSAGLSIRRIILLLKDVDMASNAEIKTRHWSCWFLTRLILLHWIIFFLKMPDVF